MTLALTYGEMFAGYGGLGMGVQAVLGGEMTWCAEFDAAPSKILAHHWPTVPNLGDVTKVDWTTVPKVDVITGGSPCQDLSHAGKRAGMKAGTRSGLWSSMCDAIETIRPRLVVWENVRGALSAEADSEMEQCAGCVGTRDGKPALRALGRVLGDFSDIGYDTWWYGLPASAVGAAHGRFRVFVYATPADTNGAGLIEHWRAVSVRLEQPAAERLGDPALTLLPTPAVNDMGAGKTVDAWDAWTDAMQAKHGNGNGHGKSLSIEAARLLPTPTTTQRGTDAKADEQAGAGPNLHNMITRLLPTPTVNNGARNDDTNQDDDDEELRDMRGADGAQTVREATGGLLGVLATSPLQPELCEHQTRGDEGRAALAGTEVQEDGVRNLLDPTGSACASQRQEPSEQRPCEPDDALRELSPETALAGGSPEADGWCAESAADDGQDWGEYTAAIRRWEMVLGRVAPPPTTPGKNGQPRLSAVFTEWLMGLPAGHVTDVPGISRNDQLKALGNGVVVQQAAAATRAFLADQRDLTDQGVVA